MWFLYAASFVVLTTILAMYFKKIAGKTQDQRVFAFLFNFFSLIVSLIVVLIIGLGEVSLNRSLVALIVLSGILHGLFHRYHFVARKHIEASSIETIMAPGSIAGYLLAIFWLGEVVTINKVVGYLMILGAGTMAVTKRDTKITFNKFILLALFISACASASTTIDRYIAPNFSSVLTYATILWLVQTAVCYVPRIKFSSLKQELIQYKFTLPLLAAVNAVVLFCLVSALKLAPATSVMPVANSNVVFIALAAIVFLGERSRVKMKVLSAVLACVGLFLVTR